MELANAEYGISEHGIGEYRIFGYNIAFILTKHYGPAVSQSRIGLHRCMPEWHKN